MATPSFEDLKAAVTALAPLAESDADEAESLRRLTDRVVAGMRRTRLYQMLLPKPLGGIELPFVEAMAIVEMLSRAEGSAGWCLMVQNVQVSSAGPHLPEAGARDVFPDGPDVTVAGQGVPRGYAWPVDGGYRIKGHWAYGSGIHHAEWVHSGCFVMDGEKMRTDAHGHPAVVLCHHPKDTIELKGNWDVLGLRGTGSYDYTVKDGELFVPETHCYKFDNPTLVRGGVMFSSGLVGTTSWGHTSWALGIGRRTLDELARHARERADAYGKMADSPTFKQSYAEAEGKYRAARAFVYAAWDDLCESYAQGRAGTVEQIALIRLAMRHIHNVISENATFAHRASRGISLRASTLQRCYRDVHGGTQHLLLADEITQDCGKVLLGAAADGAAWNVLGLQEH